MDPVEYERMYQVEQSHWWYLGMQTITRAMLDRYVNGSDAQILDAGCGTGAAMSACLPRYGQVTGCDFSILALRYCHQRAIQQITQASVTALPFPPEFFDLITSFDVLYERGVDSPAAALAEFKRILRPAGKLLLRLPAYDWLRGQHDQAVHTGRRFDARSLSHLLNESGLRPLHITYANTFLFPLAVLKRLLERVFPPAAGSSDLALGAGLFNPLLTRILAAEAPIAAGRGLPFGLSVIAIAQKEGLDEQ